MESTKINSMLRLLFMLILAASVQTVMAQSQMMAKMKYEEAEEAYVKNDFKKALAKVEETEAMLKAVNPKTAYLKIMSLDQLFGSDYALFDKLRKACGYFLANYETVEGIEDKYRDVYKISEKLKGYPQTRIDFEAQVKNRPLVILDSLGKAYGFKAGLTVNAFKAYNPEAAAYMTKENAFKHDNGLVTYSEKGSIFSRYHITDSSNYISNMTYTVVAGSSSDMEESVNQAYEKLHTFLLENFKENCVVLPYKETDDESSSEFELHDTQVRLKNSPVGIRVGKSLTYKKTKNGKKFSMGSVDILFWSLEKSFQNK